MGIAKWRTLVLVGGLAGCAVENAEGPVQPGVQAEDIKPGDASELEDSNVSMGKEAHTQHYVDGTNQWGETAYPMGTDNPNCKDWWVYDRYLSVAPAVGVTGYSTLDTWHNFATGTYIDQMLASIPTSLGYNTALLKDHNSEVARTGSKAGKCSGRYVFQWDNHDSSGTNNFPSNAYGVTAYIPPELIPGSTSTACNARDATNIAHAWVDLYVCEAPTGSDIGSFSSWCGVGSGHWRKAGSAYGDGYYNSYWKRCDTATAFLYYSPPSGKSAVSFNAVVKAGVGHAVAPAHLDIFRYN